MQLPEVLVSFADWANQKYDRTIALLCKECRKVLTFAVWLPPSYMDCYLIIYMKKLLDSDWLRIVQFFLNTVQKRGNSMQKKVIKQAFWLEFTDSQSNLLFSNQARALDGAIMAHFFSWLRDPEVKRAHKTEKRVQSPSSSKHPSRKFFHVYY